MRQPCRMMTGPNFNPRSPCGERPLSIMRTFCASNFNPRSPCGERLYIPSHQEGMTHFNPRSPCGERRRGPSMQRSSSLFQSTLSLRRATTTTGVGLEFVTFQSTLSLRRATSSLPHQTQLHSISIHALLAESDIHLVQVRRRYLDFNPRSPCGERLGSLNAALRSGGFQSTLSLRRATNI